MQVVICQRADKLKNTFVAKISGDIKRFTDRWGKEKMYLPVEFEGGSLKIPVNWFDLDQISLFFVEEETSNWIGNLIGIKTKTVNVRGKDFIVFDFFFPSKIGSK